MKKNLLLLKLLICFGFAISVNNYSFAQVKVTINQGDYRSAQDGSWGNPATWEQYHNTFGWRSCVTANIAPPNKASYVVIKSGTTVTIDNGENIPAYLAALPYGGEGRTCAYPYEVSRLIIESGARLVSTDDHNLVAGSLKITHPFSNIETTNAWDNGGYTLKVFGNWVQNDGEIGGPDVDGIIIEMPAPYTTGGILVPATGFTMSGSGATDISKLRMTGGSFPSVSSPGPDIPVVIDLNMNINGAGSVFTCVYKPVAGDNYTLRINPGKTVTLTNELAVIHDQSLSNGNAPVGGKYLYDIDGTLDAGAGTSVNTFTKLAPSTSLITVNVTQPGKLIVQQALTKSAAPNSLGDVIFLPETGSGVVLPLNLLSFSAKLKEGITNEVLLNWSSNNEVNTREFEIQRSADAKNFVALGSVKTTNRSGTHNYSYIDSKPLSGTSYYILKQADLDGKFKYSPVVSVFNKGNSSLVAFPNPTRNKLTVLHDKIINKASIQVIGTDGKSLLVTAPASGSTQTILNVSNLKAGYYLIKLENGTGKSVLKFVIN
ncbi:MAG: T9SS type A sorting domain-containing protein [Bacteroidota bacterium]